MRGAVLLALTSLLGLTSTTVSAAPQRIGGNLVAASGFETCPEDQNDEMPGWTRTGSGSFYLR